MIYAIVAEKTNEFSVTMNYAGNMSVKVSYFSMIEAPFKGFLHAHRSVEITVSVNMYILTIK